MSGNKLNKNSKITKKNIAVISTLGIFLLIGFIGIPELTRNLLFYPDAPTANFPIPNNETEARLQDLEYFENYVRGYDRSFHFRARGIALSKINELKKDVDKLSQAGFELAISEIVALGENGHSNVWNGSRAKRYPSCLLYTSPSPRDQRGSRMPSSA